MNDLGGNAQYNAQAWAMQNSSAQRYPETPAEILGVALSRAKQKRDEIQKVLDSVPKLRDELANYDALIARLEGKEDE